MCNPNMNASELTEAAPPSPTTNLYRSLVSIPDAAAGSAWDCSKSTCIDPPTHQPSYHHYYEDIISEAMSLFRLCFPIGVAGLLLYARSVVSMLFLGSLGELELAAGSLASAFANITGYSVLLGLALGMEPFCAQAYGAKRPKLLSLTLHRAILFLLSSSLPISLLWSHVSAILGFIRQDPEIAGLAQKYLLFCLPDLATFSFIHPIRIYLRTQGITLPITISSLTAAAFHVPANLLLVTHLRLGVPGSPPPPPPPTASSSSSSSPTSSLPGRRRFPPRPSSASPDGNLSFGCPRRAAYRSASSGGGTRSSSSCAASSPTRAPPSPPWASSSRPPPSSTSSPPPSDTPSPPASGTSWAPAGPTALACHRWWRCLARPQWGWRPAGSPCA